jgi:hypothetical protein
MSHRRTIVAAGAVLAAAALLAGCSAGSDAAKPGPADASAPASASSTPTPTVGGPADEAAAYSAANKLIDAYLVAQAKVLAAPENGAGSLARFESGAALTLDEQAASAFVKAGLYTDGGATTWAPVASKTSYGETKNPVTGAVTPNGRVQLAGCLHVAATTLTKSGQKPTSTVDPDYAASYTVTYSDSQRNWFIVNYSNNVSGVSC